MAGRTKRGSTPTLADLFNEFGRHLLLSLNCHAVGEIEEFDPSTMSAKISIAYQKVIVEADPVTGKEKEALDPYPPLVDVPVVFLRGGSSYLTMPIAVRDKCIVLFNDRDADMYITSGQANQSPSTGRLHSFADAIAIVGLATFDEDISEFDSTGPKLGNGTTYIRVGPNKLKLANANDTLGTLIGNIQTLIQNLKTQLNTAFTTNAVNGSPLDPGWSAATASIDTAITNLSTEIGNLLE